MNYDRKILIPYLKSVMEVELAIAAINAKRNRYQGEINYDEDYLNRHGNKVLPPKPQRDNPLLLWGISILAGIGVGIAVYLGCLVCGLFPVAIIELLTDFTWETFKSWARFIAVVIGIAWTWYLIHEEKTTYDLSVRRYYEDKENATKIINRCKQYRSQLSRYHTVTQQCEEELKRLQRLRRKVYRVNIIPDNYRDLYSIAYLHRYFSTSRATDLDMIIQTLLMDEIKRQLVMIRNDLHEIINNQNAIIGRLDGLRMEVNETNTRQMRMIADTERNQELKNDYLRMIEANTSANAYFQAATALAVMKK